jgi:uncharacterized membrane protein YphA (DoxX/SURF4 family)
MIIKEIYALPDEGGQPVMGGPVDVGPQIQGDGLLGDVVDVVGKTAAIISMIIGLLTIIGIIILLFSIISAGIMWINSGGDPQKVEIAQKKLTNSFIGLILIIGAVFIVSLLGKLLFEVDLMDLGGLFERLSF